jgi:hypothetical protein
MHDGQLLGRWQGERPPMPLCFKLLLLFCVLGFAYLMFSVIKDWNYRAVANASQELEVGRN